MGSAGPAAAVPPDDVVSRLLLRQAVDAGVVSGRSAWLLGVTGTSELTIAGEMPRWERRQALRKARVAALCAEYGTDTIAAALPEVMRLSEKRVRDGIAAWPDGVYEADAYVDHDPLGNPDVHLHVKITVDGDTISIDYPGSDTRPELQAWPTFGAEGRRLLESVGDVIRPGPGELLWDAGDAYDLYTQIGIGKLIGLAAKNAVLIGEYAKAAMRGKKAKIATLDLAPAESTERAARLARRSPGSRDSSEFQMISSPSSETARVGAGVRQTRTNKPCSSWRQTAGADFPFRIRCTDPSQNR